MPSRDNSCLYLADNHRQKLRSSIVHGSRKRLKVEDTLELIVYARRCLISFYILYFNRIGINTPTKDLKQDLLQEIDQAMIDSSSGSLQKEISDTTQDFEISGGIPFMIDDRDWKVKNNLPFDMTHYLTDHNLDYDHKSACMQSHAHLRDNFSIDS